MWRLNELFGVAQAHPAELLGSEEMRKLLEAEGKKSGKILAGICKPGVAVLEDRYKGVKKGLDNRGGSVGRYPD